MIFTAAFVAGLALLEYFFFFSSNPHFFQGDSIYYFYRRHQTVADFLFSFFQLDAAGWYRPLTARTVQSLFYPWFGFEPAAYRVVHYLLFMGAVLATYKLALVVTRRRVAAGIAAVFLGIHTVSGWTTYDVLFTPEIVFTFFYVAAAAAYLRYRQSESRRLFMLSIACFIAGLFSKETALTLPLMLVALDVVLNRTRIAEALAAARAHLLILAVYLVLVIGYLGVQRPAFKAILKRPGPEVSYRFALDRTILNNASYAATWSFNIPRGWQTESRQLSSRSITFLKFFRAGIMLLALGMLFRPERRLILAGFIWFSIGIAPALPLFEHFLPYYLFMPLVGLSMVIGTIADAVFRKIAVHNAVVAGATVAIPLILLAGVCAVAVRREQRDNRLLGGSSRLAENSMNDLKKAHPYLQPNTTIYISDAEEPDLAWDTAQGELFKMAYNEETLRTLYWGWGEVITSGLLDRPLIVMKLAQSHLTDVTREFIAASEPAVSYFATQTHRLEITPAAVGPGQKYQLSISGLPNTDVTIHYTLNGGPVHAFAAHLDADQQVSFDVSAMTEKGLYKFVGFHAAGAEQWEQAAASIRIN